MTAAPARQSKRERTTAALARQSERERMTAGFLLGTLDELGRIKK